MKLHLFILARFSCELLDYKYSTSESARYFSISLVIIVRYNRPVYIINRYAE